jgi:hypothetical protein
LNDERPTFYTGPRSWPISAAVSLCSSSSIVISILVGKSLELHLPQWIELGIVIALGFFFVVGMWMSILGGGSLMFMKPTDDVGSWTFRGRPVSQKVWRRVLVICYFAPWIAIGWFALRVVLTA